MDFISIHPMYTHANIINKKKLNITANINTAKVANNRANILSRVSIKMVPPLALINQSASLVIARDGMSTQGDFLPACELLLVLRPCASTRFLRRRLGIGSYVFSLINDGTVGGSSRSASSSTSRSSL
jgi:hypothetical protein